MNSVQRIFKKSEEVITKAPDSFGYIAVGMGVLILLTKLTSLVKSQILIAIYSIKSVELDLFNAANVIPEFIFSIVVIGGINAALIPVFNKITISESEKEQKLIFSTIVNIFIFVLLILCSLVFIFTPQILGSITQLRLPNTNNSLSPADFELLVELVRILIFSPIILCVSSIFSSILQVKKAFWITALAPLFYNIGIIFSSYILTHFNNDIKILAYGVLLASFLHFMIQLPSIIQAGIQYNPFSFEVKNFYVVKAIKNTLPRTIGLTSDYIGSIFQSLMALNLVTGSLNALRLATSIRELPASLFGLSIAQSVFPRMSELVEKGDNEGFQKIFSKAIRMVLFWTIPVTAIFIVLRTPISQLLFGLFQKEGDFEGTNMVAYALLFLSLSVIFFSVLGIVNRAFYSLNDSVTPTIVSIIVIFFELTMTYTLVNLFSHFDESLSLNPLYLVSNIDNYFSNGNSPAALGGIALASTLAIGLNVTILIFRLRKKGPDFFYEAHYIYKKFISGILMLLVGFLIFKYTNDFFDTTRVVGVFLTTLNSTFFMLITYYLSEKLLLDEDISLLDNFLSKGDIYFKKVKGLFKRNKIVSVGTD